MLPRVPFYPEVAIVPLIIVPAFLALVWPFGGGVLTLALLAPPIFALRRRLGGRLRWCPRQ